MTRVGRVSCPPLAGPLDRHSSPFPLMISGSRPRLASPRLASPRLASPSDSAYIRELYFSVSKVRRFFHPCTGGLSLYARGRGWNRRIRRLPQRLFSEFFVAGIWNRWDIQCRGRGNVVWESIKCFSEFWWEREKKKGEGKEEERRESIDIDMVTGDIFFLSFFFSCYLLGI